MNVGESTEEEKCLRLGELTVFPGKGGFELGFEDWAALDLGGRRVCVPSTVACEKVLVW